METLLALRHVILELHAQPLRPHAPFDLLILKPSSPRNSWQHRSAPPIRMPSLLRTAHCKRRFIA
eukprot:1063416-Rhodomonas_salina.1